MAWPEVGELRVIRGLVRTASEVAARPLKFTGKRVGVVLATEDGEVLAVGYNNVPKHTKARPILRAIRNALILAAEERKSLLGSTLYSTLEPCAKSVKLLWEVGVARVICPRTGKKPSKGKEDPMELMAKLGMDYMKVS